MKKIVFYTTANLDPKNGTGVAVAFGHMIEGIKKKGLDFNLLTVNSHYKTFGGYLLKRIINNYLNKLRIKADILLGIDFDGFLANKNTKYILNLRSNFSEIKKQEKGYMKLTCLIEEYFQKKAVKRADKIIVASHYTKNSVANNYKVDPNKIVVIPNGIDNKVFFKRKNDNENIILSVAALYPRKGVQYLIEALKIIKVNGIPFKHIHIGKGVQEESLKKLVRELGLEKEVNFIGNISDRNTVSEYYNKTKVFCHPCLQEDFGNVFLEAMACGKPIVAFNNSAASELITNGKNGFLIKDKDISELASKLEMLLINNQLCKKIEEQNLKKVKKYSWEVTSQKFIKEITML